MCVYVKCAVSGADVNFFFVGFKINYIHTYSCRNCRQVILYVRVTFNHDKYVCECVENFS